MPTSANTADRILDVTEKLVQLRGFNGFSYADIAAKLKIQKASLHYHFATKSALGSALIERYQANFLAALDRIEHSAQDTPTRLRRYVDLYRSVLKRDRMCLCGMLAAEYATLPKAMRKRVNGFFDANQAWVARILDAGRQGQQVSLEGDATARAQLLISSLEGAMLVARSYGEVERFDVVARSLLEQLVEGAGGH